MPPLNYLSISLSDVYQRVGTIERTHVSQSDLRPKKPFDAKHYGLLVYWPRSLAWLDVRLKHGDPGVEFKADRDGLAAICQQVGADVDHVAPPKFLQAQAFQAACVAREAPIALSVRVDTDHEGFKQAILAQEGALARQELVQTMQVRFFDAKSLGVYLDQEGTIQLILKPAIPVPAYDGFVALDLGNTSSTLVGLSLSQAYYRTSNIRVVNADAVRGEMKDRVEPAPSNVRIDRIRSYEPPPPGVRRFPDPSIPKDDYPQSVNWVAGRLANPQDGSGGDSAATNGLVLGAKRLIAGKDWEKTQKIIALHRHAYQKIEQPEQIDLLNRMPAELLVCRLMQRFREAACAWPRSLAVTYPTTYSPRELEQLREVVQRAWLRMQTRLQRQVEGLEEQPDPDPQLESHVKEMQRAIAAGKRGGDDGHDPVIRLLVDEASAAAFFFLYRRIFEAPSGLRGFRYMYPRGLNMLLYDCGGGTTDIALVKAGIDADAPDVLRISVLARSGLRGFGGDDITRAVCRLLKAKLAMKVAEARNKPLRLAWPAPPSAGAAGPSPLAQSRQALEDVMQRLKEADPRDELVPTTFNADQLDDASGQRRDHAFDLWRWGEMMKARLEKSSSAAFIRIDRHLNRLSAALLKGLNDSQAQQLIAQLEKITVQRWEIDALVEDQVLKSIRNCNNLIRDRLVSGPGGERDADIHWVVASGNGSRYPLIREAIQSHLNVLFADERLTLDEENLKHAVAKGAVLALGTVLAMGTVRVEFDSDLSNTLPFDVAYKDLLTNTNPILYREHTRYENLEKRTVPLTAIRGASASATKVERFVLERRFPGDEGFSPYLAFHFPDGIRGDLEVAYDSHTREFTVRDVQGNVEGELRDVAEASIYRSPAQRGDL